MRARAQRGMTTGKALPPQSQLRCELGQRVVPGDIGRWTLLSPPIDDLGGNGCLGVSDGGSRSTRGVLDASDPWPLNLGSHLLAVRMLK